MPRVTRRKIVFAAVIAFLLLLSGVNYWNRAWRSAASRESDSDRLRTLNVLAEAVLAYRSANDAWPPDLETVTAASTAIAMPPTSGEKRVEYLHPPDSDGVFLIGYGYIEPQPGWDLSSGAACWVFLEDGSRRLIPEAQLGR